MPVLVHCTYAETELALMSGVTLDSRLSPVVGRGVMLGTKEHTNAAYCRIPNFDKHFQLSAWKRLGYSTVGAAISLLHTDNRWQPKCGVRCCLLVHDCQVHRRGMECVLLAVTKAARCICAQGSSVSGFE